MKPLMIALLGACLFGCANAKVGPKPDIRPVLTGNENTRRNITATRKSIGESRKDIQSSQTNMRAGDKHLQSAEEELDEVLKQ